MRPYGHFDALLVGTEMDLLVDKTSEKRSSAEFVGEFIEKLRLHSTFEEEDNRASEGTRTRNGGLRPPFDRISAHKLMMGQFDVQKSFRKPASRELLGE